MATPTPITRQSVELNDFIIREVFYPAGLEIPSHTHANTHLSFIPAGRMEEEAGNVRFLCETWSVHYRPAGRIHSNRVYENTTGIIIEIAPSAVSSLSPVLASVREAISIPAKLIPEIPPRLRRELASLDPMAKTALHSAALELITATSRLIDRRLSAEPPQWLANAVDLIDRSYRRPLKISAVAGTLGVSPAILSSWFRRERGISIGEYVRTRRVDDAAAALRASESQIGEIARACGFFDQSHLVRVFKQQMGMTPSEYRNSNRQRSS